MKGYVYKLIHKQTGDILYVGSTVSKKLMYRLAVHRCLSLIHPNRPLYKAVHDLGGWDNIQIETLYEMDCERKIIYLKEREFIDTLKPPCNKVMPSHTVTPDEIKARARAAYARVSQTEEFKQKTKDKWRKLYDTRKEEVKAYSRAYYHRNKEAIKARRMLKCVQKNDIKEKSINKDNEDFQDVSPAVPADPAATASANTPDI